MFIILFLFVKFTIILSKGIPSLVKISNNPVKDANCKVLLKKKSFNTTLTNFVYRLINLTLKYKVAVPSPSINDSDMKIYLKIFQNRQTQYLLYSILIAYPLYLKILHN